LIVAGSGIIANAAYDAIRAVERRIRNAILDWLARRFGATAGVSVDMEDFLPRFQWKFGTAAPSGGIAGLLQNTNLIIAALALLAQAGLLFTVVWLLAAE
jgi:hypothetical protein